MEINTAFIIILLALLVVICLYKIRKVHLMLFKMNTHFETILDQKLMDTYHQIEALISLYNDLKFEKGLPKTREWAASPDFLKVTADILQRENPKIIVECSSGVSTLIAARIAQLNNKGHVYSLENDVFFAKKTRELLKKFNLSKYATVIDTPLIAHDIEGKKWMWYDLSQLPDNKIDVLIIDGPPSTTGPLARYPAGPLLFNQLSAHAHIIIDDSNREDEKEIIKQWQESFFQMTQLPYISCEKGCTILANYD